MGCGGNYDQGKYGTICCRQVRFETTSIGKAVAECEGHTSSIALSHFVHANERRIGVFKQAPSDICHESSGSRIFSHYGFHPDDRRSCLSVLGIEQ